eukprot:TRINITY_DN5919_c0_g1_i3.p1 TRINITY_DN5919_c0_g1~~TRINITY_DN5919_c0_g1_i3.p1  ORF type:complete len:207 (+),score=62.63 TRINITY_DN5919_c0_g1_i3:472-1092(+)
MKDGKPDDTMFKAITRANDILNDPKLRRSHDSGESFDNSIPNVVDDSDFFELYRPVFARNAKWSVNTPIPDLGDETSSYSEVTKFYNFWFNFTSWRDFSYLDEYEPEQAEVREEKRWMERQNEKDRAKRKKEENLRINTLVENAYKKDWRIKKFQQDAKNAKVRKREAERKKREDLKRKTEEDNLRRLREEEEKKKARRNTTQKRY